MRRIGYMIASWLVAATVLTVAAEHAWGEMFSFQHNVAGYTGTVDTYIDGTAASTNQSANTRLAVGATHGKQTLIRFDDIFGAGAGQIPSSANVSSATLLLQTGNTLYDGTSPAAVTNFHRLLQPFNGSETYNSSFGGNGVDVDDVEAVALPDFTIGPNENIADGDLVSVDVTASLQAWAGGNANQGWVIDQIVDNRWFFSSAEGSAPPKLIVEATSGVGGTVSFQEGDANGYAGTQDTWFSPRDTSGEKFGFPNSDYFRTAEWPSTNQQALLRFDDIFGAGADQVPLGSMIDNATLTITVDTRQYSNGEANAVYKMLVDWLETDAFDAAQWAGGDTGGIDRDDVEAAATAVTDATAYAAGNGIIDAGTVMDLDVTSIVQDWSDGDANYGFLLQSLGLASGDGLFMDSSESASQSERPKLTINYVPEPSGVLLMGLGVLAATLAFRRRPSR